MKNKNIIQSFSNAFSGIFYAIKSEKNMKIHIFIAIMATMLGIYLKISKIEFLILGLAISFVIICELFNTILETISDIISYEYHPKIKIIKDIAAGTVLFSACLSIIIGYFIFGNKLIKLFF